MAVDDDLDPLVTAELFVPTDVQRERSARRYGMNYFASPYEVGLHFDLDAMSDVAWCVLSRAHRDVLIAWLAMNSMACEELADSKTWMPDTIRFMKAPEPVERRLLEAFREGRTVLYPRALQWIVRELAAADESELAARRSRVFSGAGEEASFAKALFPSLSSDGPVTAGEAALAAWVLHEAFQRPHENADDPVAGMAAVTFGMRPRWSWLRQLDRWRALWSVDDSHPSVRSASRPPSEVRALLEQALGLDVVAWIAGVWAMCIRWSTSLRGMNSMPQTLEDAFHGVIDEELFSFSQQFRAAFESHVVSSVAEFGEAARAEAGSSYDGLGSLPQRDSLAARNRPVLVASDGFVSPLSLTLLADRATALHRFVLKDAVKGGRNVNHTPGRMYEAYGLDTLRRLEPAHRILSEADVAAVARGGSLCDAVVAADGHYVCVEFSLQTLRREVADGDSKAVVRKCAKYHGKADQAVSVLNRLDAVASALGLRPPVARSILLVVDDKLHYTPALAECLRRLNPTRSPRFVCTTQELENLVSFGEAGLSVPRIIELWQGASIDGPLSSVLSELEEFVTPADRFDDAKFEEFRRHLPVVYVEGGREEALRAMAAARRPLIESAARSAPTPQGPPSSEWPLPGSG